MRLAYKGYNFSRFTAALGQTHFFSIWQTICLDSAQTSLFHFPLSLPLTYILPQFSDPARLGSPVFHAEKVSATEVPSTIALLNSLQLCVTICARDNFFSKAFPKSIVLKKNLKDELSFSPSPSARILKRVCGEGGEKSSPASFSVVLGKFTS